MRAPIRRKIGQRGAVAVFAAITLIAMAIAMALAIDLGWLYFAQRNLQRMANLAALDSARVASGCLGQVEDRLAAAQAEAVRSVQANGGKAEYVGPGSVLVGRQDQDQNGVRHFIADAPGIPDSVEVRLTAPAPARLMPTITGDTARNLTASAAARGSPEVDFVVASSAIDLNPQFPIGPLNAGNYRQRVLSPAGLFNAQVQLGELSAEAGALTVSDFLQTQISLGSLLDSLSAALSNSANNAVRMGLQTLARASDPGLQVTPSQIIDVPAGFENAAGNAVLNVGSLVTAAAGAASGDSLLNLELPLQVPGLTGPGVATLRVIEPAKLATGPAGSTGRSAQAAVQISLPLVAMLGNPVNLSLFAEGGEGRATVDTVQCPHMGVPNPTVMMDGHANVARVGVGRFVDIRADRLVPQPVPLVELPLAGLRVRVLAFGVVEVGNNEDVRLRFQGPFPEEQSFGVQPVDALDRALADLAGQIQITVEPGSALTNPVIRAALQPLLNTLSAQIPNIIRGAGVPALQQALAPVGATPGRTDVKVTEVRAEPPVLYTH